VTDTTPNSIGGVARVGSVLGAEPLTIGDWAIASDISEWIEILAIAMITVSVIVAIILSARATAVTSRGAGASVFKHEISRGLLIGLDLLIAADIIRTVTLEPTLENVAALGLLVVVRTFLSWALELEAEGKWPWQAKPSAHPSDSPPSP